MVTVCGGKLDVGGMKFRSSIADIVLSIKEIFSKTELGEARQGNFKRYVEFGGCFMMSWASR